MNEEKILGDLALKLEKYRYNVIASLAWIVFGMAIGSASVLMNAIFLFGYTRWAFLILMGAGIIAGFAYRCFWKFVPRIDEIYRMWRLSWIFFVTPFIISYAVIPVFLNLSDISYALYYSLVWYPSLGVGLIFAGIHAEKRDEFLVTRSMTLTGIAISGTSFIFIPLLGYISSFYHVVAMSLMADGLMMGIYLFSGLYGFIGAQREIYG